MTNVEIYHLLEGAKQADGLVVIIDVFRAFSLECYLYDMGVKEVRPVGSIEESFALSKQIKDSILAGERMGKKCEGFDFGNSPSTVDPKVVAGKTVIHTTSAGTQGIINAVNASEIITGSLVNAKAIAEYIKQKQPEKVSLVCMGSWCISLAEEDELCAEYIKSLVLNEKPIDMKKRIEHLRTHEGAKFFDKNNQEVFPEKDFFLCTDYDKFPFVLEVKKDEYGFVSIKKDVNY